MSATGAVLIDFGSTPTEEATVVVSDAGVASGSQIEAFIQASDLAAASNNENAHEVASASMRITCTAKSAGVSFTLVAMCIFGLATDTFNLQWVRV